MDRNALNSPAVVNAALEDIERAFAGLEELDGTGKGHIATEETAPADDMAEINALLENAELLASLGTTEEGALPDDLLADIEIGIARQEAYEEQTVTAPVAKEAAATSEPEALSRLSHHEKLNRLADIDAATPLAAMIKGHAERQRQRIAGDRLKGIKLSKERKAQLPEVKIEHEAKLRGEALRRAVSFPCGSGRPLLAQLRGREAEFTALWQAITLAKHRLGKEPLNAEVAPIFAELWPSIAGRSPSQMKDKLKTMRRSLKAIEDHVWRHITF